MENSLTGLGIPAPATLTNAEGGPGLRQAGDVRGRIADRIEARADRRIEHIEDRSVRMQERYAELEEKLQASGYEHLANGIERRAEASASRREHYAQHVDLTAEVLASRIENGPVMRASTAEQIEVRAEGQIARAQELGETLVEFWEGAAERMQEAGNEAAASRFYDNAVGAKQTVDEHIASVAARSGELIAMLQSPPTAEGLVEAVGRHAQETTARLEAFNGDVQDRIAAASEQAMEAGLEQLAQRMSVRAERLDGRIDTRTDNILNRAAALIDRIESREMSLPDEGVDLRA